MTRQLTNRLLVLATASEARRRLVSDAGYTFTTQVTEVDESPLAGETLGGYVSRIAKAKADAVGSPPPNAIIIAADTAIGLDNNAQIIGKPRDADHAREMLTRLSGRRHKVASAIAVRDTKTNSCQTETTYTTVEFVEMSKEMISSYLKTEEWIGRAGAYAIQGRGAAFVASIEGCFTNVIGISIPTLRKMLAGC